MHWLVKIWTKDIYVKDNHDGRMRINVAMIYPFKLFQYLLLDTGAAKCLQSFLVTIQIRILDKLYMLEA